jgi:hypothetical protein
MKDTMHLAAVGCQVGWQLLCERALQRQAHSAKLGGRGVHPRRHPHEVAKRRGVKLGRKPILTPARIAHARRLTDGGESPRTVASTLRVGRTTLWRALKAAA